GHPTTCPFPRHRCSSGAGLDPSSSSTPSSSWATTELLLGCATSLQKSLPGQVRNGEVLSCLGIFWRVFTCRHALNIILDSLAGSLANLTCLLRAKGGRMAGLGQAGARGVKSCLKWKRMCFDDGKGCWVDSMTLKA
ncbi:unnamed protein product, partial [Chrysoparadoxa australica]